MEALYGSCAKWVSPTRGEIITGLSNTQPDDVDGILADWRPQKDLILYKVLVSQRPGSVSDPSACTLRCCL